MPTYQLDQAHSTIGFVATHMMFTKVRGKFTDFAGTLDFDPAQPEATSANITIQTSSIWTGAPDRDNHLRSADFFQSEDFPTMTFVSTRVEQIDDNHAKLYGDLTIRGVTQEVALDVAYLGQGTNPWGQEVVGFNATAKINREDFGLMWNQALEAGGVLVSREITIELEVQATPVQVTETA